jgi:short-subunit dehydrogenase
MNIIITGASKGIGKAVAEQFVKNGHTIIICARNEKQLTLTANELQQKYPQCKIHTKSVDVRVKEQVVHFGEWCLSIGKPDILVNNAGQFLPGSIYDEEEGTIEKMIKTNLYSAYYLTRVLLPVMMQQRSGYIFNICSIASTQAYANGGSYSISKFALLGFSKNLREELKPYGIRVSAVLPGATFTDSWKDSGVDEDRIMDVNDVAKMIYTASQLSAKSVVEDIVLRPQLGDL